MNPQGTYYGQAANMGQPVKRSKRSLVIVLLLVLVIATVAVGIGSTLIKPNEERVASSFIEKVASGDSVGTYEMLSEDAKQTTTADRWTKYVADNKAYFSGKVETVYQQKLDDSNGTEYGINVGETGKIYRVTIVMVSENGGDRVYSVRTTPTTL